MMNEVKKVFRKYADFKGRASKSEYWYFFLFNLCVLAPLIILLLVIEGTTVSNLFKSPETLLEGLLMSFVFGGNAFVSPWATVITVLTVIFLLGTYVPFLAVTFRRLHDINKPGWYYLVKPVTEIISVILIRNYLKRIIFMYDNYGIVIVALLLFAAGIGVLIFWLAKEGDYGDNSYGPVPGDDSPVIRSDIQSYNQSAVTVAEPKVQIKVICNTGVLAGQTFSTSDTLCIGRSKSSCNVVFPADTKGISRIHCCLKIYNGQAVLVDMGSTYGTFLENGKKLQPNVPEKINDNTRFYLADKNTWFTAYIEIR